MHGVEDDAVPVSLSRGFVAATRGSSSSEVPGGHMELIEPGSTAWAAVVDALG